MKGFSLLEVLISVVILAIGMLGIAQMLLVSQKANSSSYLKQQAVQSAYDIIDRMRVNRQAALSGSYTMNNIVSSGTPAVPTTPSPNCDSAACTSAQLATYDQWYWLKNDLGQLPSGCGSVSTATSGIHIVATVTVQWNDNPSQQTLGVSSPTPAQLVLRTSL